MAELQIKARQKCTEEMLPMRQETIKKLRRSSNAVKHYFIKEEDGLECFSGLSVVLMFGLMIVLVIVFGTLLGGL